MDEYISLGHNNELPSTHITDESESRSRIYSKTGSEIAEDRYVLEEDWELHRKHIFVLSSSGKPIYSRYGDEQELVTTFGLLQAVISMVQDSGDELVCIKAGNRKFVYYIKESLYFICISSTDEPESILKLQLEFMYKQILLILTAKVHDVLKNNSSKDLRDLLGLDTTRLMNAACHADLAPISISFEAAKGFVMDKDLRDEISLQLKNCVINSGAAWGVLMYEDSLVAYCTNQSINIYLHVSDILLLSHFVGNSNSLKSHDQNWVPLCLPSFNEKAFLQAYICNIRVIDLSLVLISTSSDPSMFKELHDCRVEFENQLLKPGIKERILFAKESQFNISSKYITDFGCLHFLYKAHIEGICSQWVSSPFDFPNDTQVSRDRIFTQYQRLALCVRLGTSSPDCSLLSQSLPHKDLSKQVTEKHSQTHIMADPPSLDHSIAYSAFDTGHLIIAVSSIDAELFVTFPNINPPEGIEIAKALLKSLKSFSNVMFTTI